MAQYISLQTNLPSQPVLLIDSHLPLVQLLDCAQQRIKAGTDLLESITSVSITGLEDNDLYRFTSAAYLLLREGAQLLEAVRGRMDE
ncbi:hypothetical protein NLK61_12495 [Pseudomonas fuscovaginae UPB0736]|uniref:hypothetical protein n=1 Tax=Pseudomonas asplenii TaxID=53407 RepID=UPI0002898AAA|nr:hypothetical protein [Pseudomonas fuscovaginae]UUQ67409.1 hypothetical protein NLK61_12495 [Pseudomonas fuscovaginae UPB0736]